MSKRQHQTRKERLNSYKEYKDRYFSREEKEITTNNPTLFAKKLALKTSAYLSSSRDNKE